MNRKRRTVTRWIRSRRRSSRSSSSGIDYNAIAEVGGIPKNPTVTRKRGEISREKTARDLARATAYNRPWVRGCCQVCGRPLVLKPSEARHELEIANGHEILFRSKGGDPNDSRNVLCVCSECNVLRFHRRGAVDRWLSVIIWNREQMADDPRGVEIVPWNGKAVSYGEETSRTETNASSPGEARSDR